MSDPTPPLFRFESKALDPHAFEVLRFEGTEEISRLYNFEIDLISHDCAIKLDDVIGSPASLVIAREQGERRINGIVAGVVQGEEHEPGRYAYRATLVPRLWMLSQNRRSRIYQSKSIPQIVAEQLQELGDVMPDKSAGADASDTVEFRLKQSYPVKEYLVQYAETDLDFMSRLLEHEGISYFFEQGEQCERLVITDHNDGFSSCAEGTNVPYSPVPDHDGTESVRSLVCEQRSVPRKLVLNDYNYRLPQVPLQAESNVDARGVGLIAEYGTHFSTPEEGERLSAVRSEEVLCRQRTFTGDGDHGDFHAGHRYQLAAHFREDFNQDYLISRIRHVAAVAGDEHDDVTYRNEFESVPASVTYRPKRVTVKPKLHGIMNAHVDGSGPGERAEIDDQGRYKLVMPFDLSGAHEGDGSCFIRMAQPYGGKDHGMHFPLSRGTEVVWTCIDGDPDRPIITSTVPNPVHRSVVTSENADRNVLRTAGGVTMEFSDGGLSATDRPASAPDAVQPRDSAWFASRTSEDRSQLFRQRQFQGSNELESAEEKLSGNKWFKLHVPAHTGMDDATAAAADQSDKLVSTYLRLGTYDPNDDIEKAWYYPDEKADGARLHLNSGPDWNALSALTGVFDYTEWNRTTITMHNNEQYVHGKNRITIAGGGLGLWDAGTAFVNYFRRVGSVFGEPAWRHTTVDHACSDSYQYGDTEDFFFGFKFSGFAGLETGVKLGGSLNLGVTADVNVGYGFTVDAKKGDTVDLCAEGQKTMLATEHDIICEKSVQIRTKGILEQAADKIAQEAAKTTWKAYAAGAAGAIATTAAVGGIIGGVTGYAKPDSKTEDDASTWGSSMGISLATVAWAAAIFYGAKKNKSVDADAPTAPSSFDLFKKHISLAVAGATGVIDFKNSSRIQVEEKCVFLGSGCGRTPPKPTGPPPPPPRSGSYIQIAEKFIKLTAMTNHANQSKISIEPDKIIFSCGKTVFTMDKSGFKLDGPKGEINATGTMKINGTAGTTISGTPPWTIGQ